MIGNPCNLLAEGHAGGGKSRKGVGAGGMGGEMGTGVAQPKPSIGGVQSFDQVVRVYSGVVVLSTVRFCCSGHEQSSNRFCWLSVIVPGSFVFPLLEQPDEVFRDAPGLCRMIQDELMARALTSVVNHNRARSPTMT